MGKLPNIKGQCVKSQSDCGAFFEGIFFFDRLLSNYTKMLLEQPLELIDLIKNETFSTEVSTKCLSCADESWALDSASSLCCTPLTSTSSCISCSSCLRASFSQIPFCSQCEACSALDETLLCSHDAIERVSYTSSYFAKKIYQFLGAKGPSLNVSPPFTDTSLLSSLNSVLIEQKSVPFAVKTGKVLCVSCPITAKNCKSVDFFANKNVQAS